MANRMAACSPDILIFILAVIDPIQVLVHLTQTEIESHKSESSPCYSIRIFDGLNKEKLLTDLSKNVPLAGKLWITYLFVFRKRISQSQFYKKCDTLQASLFISACHANFSLQRSPT